MEAQATEQQNTGTTREELIAMIRNSFAASNQQQQKQAQQNIRSLLKNPNFLQKLFTLLTQPGEGYLKSDLDKAVASMIKKYSYDYSKTAQDKTYFIQTILSLILNENVNFVAKELLGTALQHQFNQDQENRYRPTVMVKAFNLLAIREGIINLEGLVIVCIAYINSLLDSQQQIDFFMNSMEMINIAAMNFLRQLEKLSIQEAVSKSALLIPKISKIFQYIELSVERILDEQDYLPAKLNELRYNKNLISILELYLPLFSNEGSLVSLVCPQINEAKRIMVHIVSLLYTNFSCPTNIFSTLYLTFLAESKNADRDCTTQSILIRIIEILTFHLQKKLYYSLFADNIEQTVLSLFMYSTTSKQEYQALDNNPEEFSDIADYYVNGQQKYYNLKVKASIFIQMLAEKIDGALKHMLQLLIVVIASTLQRSSNDSQIMREIKEQTSKFDFYGMNNQKKLETSLMMLCSLSQYINRRRDTGQIIYALFITQFQVFSRVTSSIVVLRLLRCLSCYPSALYYAYIQQQIKKGKVFALQGIKCLEKMIKTNNFDELFKSLALTIANIIEYVAVTDPIMQLMITKQYQRMLKVSFDLFENILAKIRKQFYKNVQTHQHQTLICFNLLYTLLKKETEMAFCDEILSIFYEWVKFLQDPTNQKLYNKYDQKIVELFQFILTKFNNVTVQIDQFVKFSLYNISHIGKGSQFFRFYSLYICNSIGAQNKLEVLFYTFFNEMKARYTKFEKGQGYDQGISYLCFLLSAIISSYCKIDITEKDLTNLLEIAAKLPGQYKQFPLIVFLTHVYQFPYPARVFLNQKGIYSNFLNEVVKINFENGIIKKIFILSIIKLLEIEENVDNFRIILVYCINHLKRQIGESKVQNNPKLLVQPRTRLLPFEKSAQNEKQEQIQNEPDNELINLFIKFKHPFNNLSDFDQFKVLVWQNEQQMNVLSQELKADLKLILSIQWVQNKTRRILRVKK